MHKLICAVMVAAVAMLPMGARANDLSRDTSDPLFLQAMEEVFTQTSVAYWDHTMRAGQSISYGMNNRLAVGANVHYQHHFNGEEDGFSAIDFGAIYRMSEGIGMISDVVFGFKVGGSSHVRTPYYADSTYYAGLRFGRQWAGMTLAMKIQSNWVFDDARGMSFIDFSPDAYFRIAPYWRFGTGGTIRKATNKDPYTGDDYDQEWLHTKLVREYGRTQYIGHIDYEFESDEIQFGAKVNILF